MSNVDDMLAAARERAKADPTRYLETAGVPPRYRAARLTDFLSPVPAPNDCGLFLTGAPGLGKSHAAAAMLAELAPDYLRVQGATVVPDAAWRFVPELLAGVRDTFNSAPGRETERSIVERLANIGLLALDDLGAERWSEWALALLVRVVAMRIDWKRPSIVTSNLTLVEFNALDARLASRLGAMEFLKLEGEDRRLTTGGAR
jgi:DNA replication protein DnaC